MSKIVRDVSHKSAKILSKQIFTLITLPESKLGEKNNHSVYSEYLCLLLFA